MTEIVTGESVMVMGESDGWLRAVVPDHATHLDSRGYPGWARPDDFVPVGGWSPTHRVATRVVGLPIGATVEYRDGVAYLPDGLEAAIIPEALIHIGEPDRRTATEVSREFAGLPYRWGGTDSVTGTDCSGLVFRVMQLLNIPVPRDADDQFEAAPFKSRESWTEANEGDLVFFGRDAITHVGFYLGDGTYLSEHGSDEISPDGGTVIREMHTDTYFGFARYS